MMKTPSTPQRVIFVRQGFSQRDEWRSALPGAALLAVSADDVGLDAPDELPTGSTIWCGSAGPTVRTAPRLAQDA